MKSPFRILAILVTLLLLAGCTARQTAPWTISPSAAPAEAPGASPSPGATANPGTEPPSSPPTASLDGSVLPDLTPKADLSPVPAGEVNVAYAPNVPPAASRTTQAIVEVHFDVVEGVRAIDPNGTQYTTWGYRLHGDDNVISGTPGPIIRARVGDVLRFTLSNPAGNTMPHNVDFHAVTGQGGGAADLTVAPGETATIEARMLYPGMFMYHCAAGDVPLHIAEGMYGGILVDPATPLPPVEHELYIVQSEFYTGAADSAGVLTTDRTAMTNEDPTYVVFNGAVGALTGDNAPKMQVGETTRIYFIDAGINLDSNFHPIGSHWDRVWEDGALLNAPLRGVQTTLVPAGGGTVVELIGQVPQTIILVDHAITRAFDKGAIGQIVVTGDPNPELFEALPVEGTPAPPPAATPTASASEPAASQTPAPTAATGSAAVSIVPGASTFQADNAPDEFAASESPADYSVNDLAITVGTTVTWTNDDPDMVHSVTDVASSFDSGLLATGETFSHTFDQAGTFEYYCTPHPWMRARVEVR